MTLVTLHSLEIFCTHRLAIGKSGLNVFVNSYSNKYAKEIERNVKDPPLVPKVDSVQTRYSCERG